MIATAAFLLRLVPVLRGSGLFGDDTYDPSVYYSAAVGLFTGRIPYRDFLLLHPPGILLALQPFAALGAVAGDPIGMASARVAFMVMGAGSAVLIYRILLPQHRYGALVGASAYAVWYPAIYAEHSTRLEALASFVVLLGLWLLLRGSGNASLLRLFAVGALVGAGATIKIWGVALIVPLLLWLAWRQGWRRAAAALAGSATVIAAVVGPFAILAGPELWRMVVLDQLGRARGPQSLAARFVDLLGLRFLAPSVAVVPAILLGVVTLVALWLACRTARGQLFVLLTLAGSTVLLLSPTWFIHYPAFVAAPLCLVYGVAVAELFRAGPVNRRWTPVVWVVMVALGLLGTVGLGRHDGVPQDYQELARLLATRSGCVTTDSPTALIFSNTLRRNLVSGCPLVVDLSGYIYDVPPRPGPLHRATNADFQRLVLDYLGSGSTTVLIRFGKKFLSSHSLRVIHSWHPVGHFGQRIVRKPPR